ncbi:DUF4199 domain-containing protein [Dysgonomonadaceae bacterium zrk40]|nr:DUF4199 domain-containing protein [Dysgonomonadaceae bacterium zrk40]
MESNKNQILNYAMQAGLVLGVYWVFKYLFVITGELHPLLSFIGTILSIGTPLLLFYFLVKYNREGTNGEMRFGEGIQFSILLFFFASLLESLMVLLHVKWIDPLYIGGIYEAMMQMASQMPIGKELAAQLTDQPLPGAITYVFSNVIMADVFLGLILSLLIVPLAMRYKRNETA